MEVKSLVRYSKSDNFTTWNYRVTFQGCFDVIGQVHTHSFCNVILKCIWILATWFYSQFIDLLENSCQKMLVNAANRQQTRRRWRRTRDKGRGRGSNQGDASGADWRRLVAMSSKAEEQNKMCNLNTRAT